MQTIFFLFNKHTKEFIGFTFDSNSISDEMLWIRKDLSPEESLNNISWKGNYDSGEMIRLNEEDAIVTEMELIDKFYNRFFRKYSFEDALTLVLAGMAYSDTEFPDETQEMLEFFKKNVKRLNHEKKYFSESKKHDYRTKEEIEEFYGRQFATE